MSAFGGGLVAVGLVPWMHRLGLAAALIGAVLVAVDLIV